MDRETGAITPLEGLRANHVMALSEEDRGLYECGPHVSHLKGTTIIPIARNWKGFPPSCSFPAYVYAFWSRMPVRSYSGQTASACLTDQFIPTSWVYYATQLRSSDSERENGSAFSANIAPRTGGNTSKKWQFPSRTWHGIRLIKRLFKG